ncbi:C10 family peptidase [Sphingobacterium sp. InxBP1]|uniref:C10 family peptidase n=1 Tax=Sphingobacterium sp. InxBP1 TaxID=2870328 RepID=UPI00224343A2|nr:C10 family peptidase [Sphingobacterium sp. InxBP1]MCW8312534.1 C10 family peptidase [Sphingobacterium sp. InxBP1]
MKLTNHKPLSFLGIIGLTLFASCQKENVSIITNQTEKPAIRSVTDAKNIALQYYKSSINSKASTKASTEVVPTINDVQVLTSDMLISNGLTYARTKSSSTGDTLLYYVNFSDAKGGMILSRNTECQPVLAIFDEGNFSFQNVLQNTDINLGALSFILSAVDYNNSPESFSIEQPEMPIDDGGGGGGGYVPVTLVDEVLPKVRVEWSQSQDPFNRYTPNNYPAGCVAVAVAQAFTVTRHVGAFNGINLNYNDLIQFRDYSYKYLFPNQADIAGQFVRQIGAAVAMDYDASGSGAKTSDGVKLFSNFGLMNVNTNKANIRNTLKNYSNGIIIISSRTKKPFLGIARGEGHAYIADGYRLYSNGSDLIHVNYGWGPGAGNLNGYYLTVLSSPHFTADAPSTFPHDWEFYCIYK